LNANPLCLAAAKWCLDHVRGRGSRHPRECLESGARLMEGLRILGERHGIPLRPQGPGPVFHTTLLNGSVEEGPIRDYRDYVRRHDAPRWAHLRRCLLEEGVRAIERGLWFVSMVIGPGEVEEALQRAEI